MCIKWNGPWCLTVSSLLLKALKASFPPKRPSDILSLIDDRDGRYVAVLFESNGSYVGREVLCLYPVGSQYMVGAAWGLGLDSWAVRTTAVVLSNWLVYGGDRWGAHLQGLGTWVWGCCFTPCALLQDFLFILGGHYFLNFQLFSQIPGSVKHVFISRGTQLSSAIVCALQLCLCLLW